ncbi:uncharacterized protein AB675_6885 [Cyphellophora attinorum]|uniref:GPI anchored protein n=1 Tax=Cyphellophora attinorum TaxID=1664694 RepID=A0A0N1P2Z3_9EURO|nr:uncharacterized protein AB675_6885 [Phialophora attinorum]KPI43180.1 hypothetical protein AB675_6885 [Phialophora attinorum]
MKSCLTTFILVGLLNLAAAQTTDSTTTSTAALEPSPTESIGCEPHGDHWHCDGPAETGAATNATTTNDDDEHDHEHDEDEHTDAAGTGSLPPSPVASVGCEPHGDHWHCDGPASTTSTAGDAAAQTSSTVSSVTPAEQTGSSGADHVVAGLSAVVIAGMVAVL